MNPASPPALRVDAVSKRYGQYPVLQDITFSLPAGTICGLAGVNGAGKTTLIKCLLDFCSVDSGSIEILGLRHDQPGARTDLAYLPERFTPPHYLTGKQFLRILGGVGGLVPGDGALLQEAKHLGLSPDDLEKPVRSLSKGMTQKLGLSWVQLSNRGLVILDEPMSGLDPKSRATVKAMVRRLGAQRRTVLMTSHSLADIGEICDHMLVLHQGVIAYAGSPAGLRDAYRTTDLEQAFLRCIESDG